MSIYPNWLEIGIDVCTGGVTLIDKLSVKIDPNYIFVEIEDGIHVEIQDDSITVEMC